MSLFGFYEYFKILEQLSPCTLIMEHSVIELIKKAECQISDQRKGFGIIKAKIDNRDKLFSICD